MSQRQGISISEFCWEFRRCQGRCGSREEVNCCPRSGILHSKMRWLSKRNAEFAARALPEFQLEPNWPSGVTAILTSAKKVRPKLGSGQLTGSCPWSRGSGVTWMSKSRTTRDINWTVAKVGRINTEHVSTSVAEFAGRKNVL